MIDVPALGPIVRIDAAEAGVARSVLARIRDRLGTERRTLGWNHMLDPSGCFLQQADGMLWGWSDADAGTLRISVQIDREPHPALLLDQRLLDAVAPIGATGDEPFVRRATMLVDLASTILDAAVRSRTEPPPPPRDLQEEADLALLLRGEPTVGISHAVGPNRTRPLVAGSATGVDADHPYHRRARTPRLEIRIAPPRPGATRRWSVVRVAPATVGTTGRDRGAIGTLRLLGGEGA